MAQLSIEPGILDITARQGKDWIFKITVRDAAGDLVDLNGYQAAWQARGMSGAASTAAVTKTSAAGGGITIAAGAVAQQVTVTVLAAETKDIATGAYAHELELTEPDGGKPPFLAGRLTVTAEVVR